MPRAMWETYLELPSTFALPWENDATSRRLSLNDIKERESWHGDESHDVIQSLGLHAIQGEMVGPRME